MAPAKSFALARYRAEAVHRPFELIIDADKSICIQPPKTADVIEMDASTPTREVLRLLTGDQYEPLVEAIGDEDAGVLIAILKDMQEHFGLGG
ncbi:MAG: hypothetical protein JWO67_7194 [Streptosporangiaceae bacterium]|nr:hypothetical protein [Streptosporangiaceae bacterium]